MQENYKILTITHRRTDLKQIGQYVIKSNDNTELKSQLEELKEKFGFSELFYLATCNRVMFLFRTDKKIDLYFAQRFFKFINPQLKTAQIDALEDILYLLEGEAAIEHIFEVAASIDSLVVGEREILRQLREAYDQCKEWNLVGDNIRLLFQLLVVSAKEVYAQTKIGEKPVSVVSLAIQKLLASGLSKDARILLIGAGQTNSLVAKFLKKYEYNNVVVFNRSLAKAEQLANYLDAKALSLADLPNYQEGFEAIIICTGATQAILDNKLYSQILGDDKSRKFVIDLSIPNNVAAEVVQHFDMDYIEIDDLRQLAKVNLSFREQEVEKARILLQKNIEEFPILYRQRQMELAMRKVPKEIKAVKTKAMNEVFKKELENLDAETVALLDKMMTYMEKKCIGIPMKAAKELVL
jgi:glutamyl-tRNA reductase